MAGVALTASDYDSKNWAGALTNIATFIKTVAGQVVHWQGYVVCDDDGAIIAPRATAVAPAPGTATQTASTALAASDTRLGFHFQNLSEDGDVLWWQFGGTPVAGAAFKLLPGATVVREGATHCRDAVRVITATGLNVPYIIQAW